jgi:hypothetical protein
MAHKHCVLIRYEHSGAYTEPPNEFEITIFDDTTQAIDYVRKLQETYPDNTMDEYTRIKEIRFLSTLPGQGVFDKTSGGFDTSLENQSGIRTRDTDLATMKAMIKCGGSFVRNLGEAAIHADDNNLTLIKAAFPVYWKKYSDMAKTMPEEGV